jgi:hypothetical protein
MANKLPRAEWTERQIARMVNRSGYTHLQTDYMPYLYAILYGNSGKPVSQNILLTIMKELGIPRQCLWSYNSTNSANKRLWRITGPKHSRMVEVCQEVQRLLHPYAVQFKLNMETTVPGLAEKAKQLRGPTCSVSPVRRIPEPVVPMDIDQGPPLQSLVDYECSSDEEEQGKEEEKMQPPKSYPVMFQPDNNGVVDMMTHLCLNTKCRTPSEFAKDLVWAIDNPKHSRAMVTVFNTCMKTGDLKTVMKFMAEAKAITSANSE